MTGRYANDHRWVEPSSRRMTSVSVLSCLGNKALCFFFSLSKFCLVKAYLHFSDVDRKREQRTIFQHSDNAEFKLCNLFPRN